MHSLSLILLGDEFCRDELASVLGCGAEVDAENFSNIKYGEIWRSLEGVQNLDASVTSKTLRDFFVHAVVPSIHV